MSSSNKSTRSRPKSGLIDSRPEFEKLLLEADAVEHYQLRLFVTGTTTRSTQAITNIRALCEEFLTGRYDLEVIDIYQQPGQAVNRQIIAAPTLVKERPAPLKRLVGNLSDREKVIMGLNLHKKAEPTKSMTL
jgi:circadian clock protein KaiB